MLCLDIGNSQIFGGVYLEDKIILRFRHESKAVVSSDQIGIFLKAVLRENAVDTSLIEKISICSVVPSLDYSVRAACIKYFKLEPFWVEAGIKTGLNIKYKNPGEIGADHIANAIAATFEFPNQDLLIIDCGTATTFCAITADKSYLGGSIVAGLRISMEALSSKAAKLLSVEIVRPDKAIGRSSVESIQSGLYYGHLGMMKEISQHITREGFDNKKPVIIGTGGFSQLFVHEKIFTKVIPDLVLQGLYLAVKMNER
jgi:type III pantothenate kinase